MNKLAAAIAEQPFFGGLSAEHLETLAGCGMRTRFRKNQVVFQEGDLANRFYLIQTGQVVLESSVPDVRWLTVQTIGPGDVLGWSWLFEPYRWHFRARALAPASAIFFYGTRLRTQCEENPVFGYELVKRMAQVAIKRLESTQHQLIGLSRAGAVATERPKKRAGA